MEGNTEIVDANRLFDELTHKYIQCITQILYRADLDFGLPTLEIFMSLRSRAVKGEKLDIKEVLEFKKLIEVDHDSDSD